MGEHRHSQVIYNSFKKLPELIMNETSFYFKTYNNRIWKVNIIYLVLYALKLKYKYLSYGSDGIAFA